MFLNKQLTFVLHTGDRDEGWTHARPVEGESILDEVGKTVQELSTDIDKHRRRLELKALLATLPDINRELAEIDRQLNEEGIYRQASKLLQIEYSHELHGGSV